LPGLAVRPKSGSGAYRNPDAFRRRAVAGRVAVDQTEARLAFVRIDVEADPSAVGQLGVTTGAHQFASMRIRLTFEEQRRDSTLQRVDFGTVCFSGSGRKRRQLGDISFDSLAKRDRDLGSGFSAHGLPDADTEFGQRLDTVLSALGCATSNPLGGEGLDFVIGLAILQDGDLAFHLAHLRFEITQHLEQLPGFRLWQECHRASG